MENLDERKQLSKRKTEAVERAAPGAKHLPETRSIELVVETSMKKIKKRPTMRIHTDSMASLSSETKPNIVQHHAVKVRPFEKQNLVVIPQGSNESPSGVHLGKR